MLVRLSGWCSGRLIEREGDAIAFRTWLGWVDNLLTKAVDDGVRQTQQSSFMLAVSFGSSFHPSRHLSNLPSLVRGFQLIDGAGKDDGLMSGRSGLCMRHGRLGAYLKSSFNVGPLRRRDWPPLTRSNSPSPSDLFTNFFPSFSLHSLNPSTSGLYMRSSEGKREDKEKVCIVLSLPGFPQLDNGCIAIAIVIPFPAQSFSQNSRNPGIPCPIIAAGLCRHLPDEALAPGAGSDGAGIRGV